MIEIRISGKEPSEIVASIVDIFYLIHDAQRDEVQKRLANYITPEETEMGIKESQDALAEMPLEAPASPPTSQPVPQQGLPTAQAPAFDRTQIAVACTALIDSPQKDAFLDLLHKRFQVQALTELKDEQLNDFVIAIRQLGAQI